MLTELAQLRSRIASNQSTLQHETERTLERWRMHKNDTLHANAAEALQKVTAFSDELQLLHTKYKTSQTALRSFSMPEGDSNILDTLARDVSDLKTVWTAMLTVDTEVTKVSNSLWISLNLKHVRYSLESVQNTLKGLPRHIRQYPVYDQRFTSIRDFINTLPVLRELKYEAIRERHWTKIFNRCSANERFLPTSMTVGNVWSLGLVSNGDFIQQIVTEARGEMAIEDYLKEVINWYFLRPSLTVSASKLLDGHGGRSHSLPKQVLCYT